MQYSALTLQRPSGEIMAWAKQAKYGRTPAAKQPRSKEPNAKIPPKMVLNIADVIRLAEPLTLHGISIPFFTV
jgi:hypothetical protein